MGREDAYQVIKEISLKASDEIRQGGQNTFLSQLASDPRIALDKSALEELISSPLEFSGLAQKQCEAVIAKVLKITNTHPEAASYKPSAIR
jgi:adenylosuccinate lyase